MKTYKYWFFYLKNDGDENELYAYSNDKKLAEIFKSERDMNKFISFKKKITREEVNFLARENKQNILVKFKVKTANSNNRIFDTEVVGTIIEQITVNNIATRIMVCDIYEFCLIDPEIFNDEIYKALEILQYNSIYRCLTMTKNSRPNGETNIKLIADEFSIFIHHFGKTLKI